MDSKWLSRRPAFTCSSIAAVAALVVACSVAPEQSPEAVPAEVGVAVVRYSPPTDGSPARALFVGDSLTAGLYATTPEQSYRSVVSASLNGPVTSTAAAAAGLSITDGVSDVQSGLNLAVIELGTNDIQRTPISEFTGAYNSLVNRIRSSSPDAALVCLGIWGPDGGEYDSAIESSCAAGGGVFTRLNALYLSAQFRGPAGVPGFAGLSDDFHPNDAGHKALAGAVLAAVPRE
jgi:lysophospholipase L1-like esterase